MKHAANERKRIIAILASALLLTLAAAMPAMGGTIGGGNEGRCEMLASEALSLIHI